MTYPLAEAAKKLNTIRLLLTCHNVWMGATPEASIVRQPTIIDIEAAPKRYHVHINEQ